MKKISIFFSFLLIFTFFFVSSSYAAEYDLPEIPDGWDTIENEEHYIFKQFDGTINLYIFKSIPELRLYKHDNTMISIKNFSSSFLSYNKYTLVNGSWKFETGSSLSPNEKINFSMTEQFEIIYTSKDIYMSESSDEVFFPVAPVEKTLEEVLAEETLETKDKILQTMKIILLCGVGCLALLIGLNLFGKVFRIFQVK